MVLVPDQRLSLVPEVAVTREDEGDAVLVGHLDGIFVPNAPTGFRNRGDPVLGREFNAIVHGEEGVGDQHALIVVVLGLGLAHGNLHGVDAVHLAGADA